ncbi:MAG: prolipoprotein diacylglyceryl transferase, phosphatidylglycerol:prolipoprotein diacylglycerol transferase [Candidatus Peregrinibacteria bacterium GW2011_GWF2_38_29]|nr:MAG: prolipoprotein diacylglyceryl transferase, phosphatidylglycerol:prolipoprotein diacylglycerol transferase [Candidatus Peregrinibacteria bacterium GW2011_GWF2_38_29]HBB02253.1 hypothetical protein [Candidatus Peregrinibacteria bacterium]
MYPILFEYGPIAINTLWVFIIMGFLVGSLSLTKFALTLRLKLNFLRIYFFKILLSGLIVSRMVFIFKNLDYYFSDFGLNKLFGLISIWDKGLSFWGAIAGITIAFYWYAKRTRENMMKWGDVLTVSILLGMIFGYIGAFFDGTNYGSPTELPWGISFENIEIPYTIPIHPVQIYGTLFLIVLTITLGVLMLKNKIKQGNIMFIGIISYSGFRFLEEFWRGNEALEILGIRFAHIASMSVFIISLIFFLNRYNLFDPIIKKLKK